MPSRAKTAKGKAKRKGRGRKTTDWLEGHGAIGTRITNQTTLGTPATVNSATKQRLTLTPAGGGGQVGGTFTLTLGVETRDIKFNVTADDLADILKKDIKQVIRVNATGGPLHTDAIEVDFLKTKFPSIPQMVEDETDLENATLDVTGLVPAQATIFIL